MGVTEKNTSPAESPRKNGLDLVNGPILRTVILLALPVIASHFLNLAIQLADALMVGALNKEALAALLMSNQLIMLLFGLGWGIGFATITYVSQRTGAEKPKLARRAAAHAIIFALVLGLIMSGLGNLFLPKMMAVFNAEPVVTEYAITYSDIMFDYMPFFFMIFMGISVMQGYGDTVTPLIIMACINVVNIFLNYCLIFGHFGFPEMGIAGAAYGSIIARGVGSAAMLIVLTSGKYRVTLRAADFKPYLSEFWGILRLGVPNSMQSMFRNVNVIFLYRILSMTISPTVAQASLGIGFQAEALGFIPLMGLFIANGAMVGQNLGAGKPDRAEAAAWASLKTAFVLMLVVAAAFLIFPEWIVSQFNKDSHVIASGAWYLRINAITQIFQSCFVLVGALRGAGDSLNPLAAHFTGQWIIRLPLAYFLVRYSGLEEWGLWLAMATSSAIEMTIYFWLFRRGKWKRIKLVTDSVESSGD